jgi:hypothetical protein
VGSVGSTFFETPIHHPAVEVESLGLPLDFEEDDHREQFSVIGYAFESEFTDE